ncbi:MAG: hypothetical protein NVS2B12_31590 [Ktedonobacteraceae bacterium]
MPALNLAGADGFNVASGQSIQHTPDPIAPMPRPASLQGSPELGGIDPQAPIPDLNLAGAEGVPSPAQLAQIDRPGSTQIHEPDFGLPDLMQPGFHPYNLTEPGISQVQNPLFSSDPLLPDLEDYHRPYGLTIHNQPADTTFKPDPLLADLLHYQIPQGITVERDAQAPDPLLPDLQQPQLTQDVHMQQRPADLDPSAMQQLQLSPMYQQLAEVPYREVFMDQSGMNSSRRRHYDLLIDGLENQQH